MDAQIVRTPSQLGAALRRRRRSLGLSQMDLRTKTGTRQATISQLEAGHAGTLRTLFDALSALDLELVARPRTKAEPREIEDLF